MTVNAAVHRFVILLAISVGLLLPPHPARACSCSSKGTAADALRGAQAVFEGTVRSIDRAGDVHNVEFSITRGWKGAQAETLTVVTAATSAACGIEFSVGDAYLVYADSRAADGTAGVLTAHSCSRTMRADQAIDDFGHLGPGVVPVDPGLPLAKAGHRQASPTGRAGCASCRLGERAPRDSRLLPLWLLVLPGLALYRLCAARKPR